MKIKLIVFSLSLFSTGCIQTMEALNCGDYQGYNCLSNYSYSYKYAKPSSGYSSYTARRTGGRNSYSITGNR